LYRAENSGEAMSEELLGSDWCGRVWDNAERQAREAHILGFWREMTKRERETRRRRRLCESYSNGWLFKLSEHQRNMEKTNIELER
jgi:hypothetical protein